MKRACKIRIIVAGVAASAALCASAGAIAQYVWLDEKGVKQFSDRPPPASVPAGRILKEGGRPVQPADEPQATSLPKDKPPATIVEKNAEFMKRRAEQAEKDKKAQEQAQVAADRARQCERATGYHRALESGERIVRTDRNGERQYLTDEQRARELGEYKRLLQECKG